MHSFGRYCTAVIVALASLDVCAQADLKSGATPTVKSPAAARYEELLAREQSVLQSSVITVEDLRVVIDRYWSFVQRYRTSGFADNALWQAGALSAQAFERFGQERDKYRAVQLFQWLRDQYPHSPLQAKVGPQIEKLETIVAPAAPTTIPAVADTTIRAVHRMVLAEVVRVTLEIDREVPFYQERLEGPARVFFDLKGTKTVPSLVDATFRYDSDVIRHIRIGRHPNNTTRVVLDLENVSRFSVFTLYNPYRIVIDAERSAGVLPKPGGSTMLVARIITPKTVVPFARLAPVARIAPVAPIALTSRTLPVRAAVPVAVIARAAVVLPAVPPPSTPPARGQARGADSTHTADSTAGPGRRRECAAPAAKCAGCDRGRGHRG